MSKLLFPNRSGFILQASWQHQAFFWEFEVLAAM